MTNIELIKILLDDIAKYGNRQVLVSDVESDDTSIRNTVSNEDGFFIEFKY